MGASAKSDMVFLPLGGCGEIGMNCNLFGHRDAWLAVDCGITLEQQPGALRPTVQMPDLQFISSRREQLVGLIVTHAHEDHLGALPYLWEQLRCRVYATPFAASVLRYKTRGRGGTLPSPLIEIEPGEQIALGPFAVEWIPITHSTPETCALSITTQSTRVLHTADWKIDTAPVVGRAWSSSRLVELGRAGIDAVVCDSTNALKEGHSPSEGEVAAALEQVIANCEGRVVVGCFSSNVARMQTLATIAARTGRYLGILGRSAAGMARCAQQSGLLKADFRPIHGEHLGYLPPQEVLAIATGSQGEWGAMRPTNCSRRELINWRSGICTEGRRAPGCRSRVMPQSTASHASRCPKRLQFMPISPHPPSGKNTTSLFAEAPMLDHVTLTTTCS